MVVQGCHYEAGAGDFPRLLSYENRRKIVPKETRSSLIPRLLVVFTRQLEILVTALVVSRNVGCFLRLKYYLTC